MLHQSFGLFQHHFGHLNVARGRLVKGGCHYFAPYGAAHLGHLFRAFVDQQHDQMTFGVVAHDGLGDVLQHQRFTGFGRRYDQAALAFADGRHQVDDARSNVFSTAVAHFHDQALLREQGCQVFKQDLVFGVFRSIQVDLVDFQQCKVTLTFFRRANFAGNGIPGPQIEAADLAGGYIDVVRTGQVRTFGGAEEAKTILQDFQHTIPEDVLSAFGVFFQNAENHVLLAGSSHVFQAHFIGDVNKFSNRFCFEFGEIHFRGGHI